MSHEDEDDDDIAELFSFGVENSDVVVGSVGPDSGADDAQAAGSRHRSNSDDSLLDMIENEGVKGVLSGGGLMADHDAETQDILNWLDTEDDTAVTELLIDHHAQDDESETMPPPPPQVEPTVVALPPIFATLQEALDSKQSTSEQIRLLALTEPSISKEQRPELYCRLICNKTLKETQTSSLADSFDHWSQSRTSDGAADSVGTAVEDWTKGQANILGEKFGCNPDDLQKLLFYQFRSHGTEQDPLLPTVAATLLATGLPLAAASVVLHQMLPSYMPLLHLPPTERWEASLSLHSEFYLLAVYHLPLLVFHLDRYLPGWQWPQQGKDETETELEPTQKGRNLKSQGQLPPSWLLSHFAGECYGTFYLSLADVFDVWDLTFTRKESALRFFLTLALLEQAADTLLLITGVELKEKFESALRIHASNPGKSIRDWAGRAEALLEATPDSVVAKLQKAEDFAVQQTLKRRQDQAEREMKAKMEAEAIAHKAAQEKKAEEARERLNRARLVAFYRKHMPDKESNVDTILVNYAGRLDVLEKKLKAKYGEGFNPVFKPKQEPDAKEKFKLLANINTGIGGIGVKEKSVDEASDHAGSAEHVTVLVSASEVLPVFCWSKEAAAARQVEHKRVREHRYLKFCIVDSRTEAAAMEQGRFPTAMNLSPETMMDPDKLKDAEERFESLRGAAHIVIMGDGFSALPVLYDYKLNARTEELIQEDQSRMQICALFFVKRGFPFVSILDGGYAACHSWLIREGPSHDLAATDVLSDYIPSGSLFGQLETFHNASGAEKAQRRMQNILDKSLTVVAKRAQQLENFANELDNVEPSAAGFRSLFGRGGAHVNKSNRSDASSVENNDGDGIKNFFAGIGKSLDDERRDEEDLVLETKSSPSLPAATDSIDSLDATTAKADHESAPKMSNNDTKLDQKATPPAVNTFANLWRRGTSGDNANTTSTGPGLRSLPEKSSQATMTEAGAGIGGFLKRNPFARLGGGGGITATKPNSVKSDAAAAKDESDKDASQSTEEIISFTNPVSDEEEEVTFEIGDGAEATEDFSDEGTSMSPGDTVSKAEIQQV